jgi:DNA-binding NarL/FixJ family response regulator
MGPKIRILLLDDHSLFREGLSCLLRAEPDLRIVGNCASISEALAILDRQPVDIVLLDHDLGEERGSVFLEYARDRRFEGRVLMVTAGMTDAEMVQSLRAGSAGVFLKHSPPGDLVKAIHAVFGGEMWLDPRAVRSVVAGVSETAEEPRNGQVLNDRERAVLRAVFEGLSNKEIASRLQWSENSVKWVIRQLFAKTGAQTRSQLVRIVLEGSGRSWLTAE